MHELYSPEGTYEPTDHLLAVAELAAKVAPEGADVLDLGTGVGTLAIELAMSRPDVRVRGVDINPAAIKAARSNAARLNLGGRVRFGYSDVYSNVTGRYDVIMSSMPYDVLQDGESPELDCECGMHRPAPYEAIYDDHMATARALGYGHAHLVPGGSFILFAQEGFAEVFRLSGWEESESVREEDDTVTYVLKETIRG